MMRRRGTMVVWVLLALLAAAPPALAGGTAVSKQIGTADTGLLIGGADAEGGIGDWYVSNGVVEAIIDDAGPAPDLPGIVPPEDVPPINSSAAPTGGNLIDLGVVGTPGDDQLSQMFTVGGLSTSNFVLYDTVTAPSPGVVRAAGALLFSPSTRENPCLTLTTDYSALGSDPFLTIVTTATNQCAGTVTGFTG